ncbi:MAG: chromate transporter [Candidatus Sumerlaeia bacterium]
MQMLSLLGQLFLSFFKTGLFSWGGGTAMLALMESECVRQNRWLSPEQFSELVSANAVVPGVFAVKFAAFVGWQQAGLLGAITTVAGICAPGVGLFIPFYLYLQRWKEYPTFERFMDGIQFGAAGMILYSVLKVVPQMPGRTISFALGLILTALVTIAIKFGLNPIYAILLAGLIGLFIF